MNHSKRLQHFDVLKGVAILLVIWGHVFYFGMDHYTDNAIYTLITAIHMPLFAMLSGFFFTKPLDLSRGGIARFWLNKATRLLLPLLVLPLLYNWIRHGFSMALPLNMYLNEYWFTYALFIVFIIFYIYRLVLSIAREREREFTSNASYWSTFYYCSSLRLQLGGNLLPKLASQTSSKTS